MKKIFTLVAAALMAANLQAEEVVETLDLTKAVTELSFDADNGSWTGTFDEDAEVIESQCFMFSHSCVTSWSTWWGFTASNKADNSKQTNNITYQYSNMAKGGIVLNEDGTVKKDENGVVVVSADVPYIVGYYNSYMASRPVDLMFNDGLAHEAVGVYVNLNTYSYYSMQDGDAYARQFNRDGDKFTLTIHGVKEDESEATVEVTLGAANNGDQTLTRGWKYVDLSSLGKVNEIYFTMSSTDVGAYGMNTPGYFCLDKLMVKSEATSVPGATIDGVSVKYDAASKTVNLSEKAFVAVYNTNGQVVKAADANRVDLSDLDRGVYLVKTGAKTLKIAR